MQKLDIIVKTLEDKLADDINVIKLEDSSVADYFVVATGNSVNQTRALADYIEESLAKEGYDVLSNEGLREGEWILIDVSDVIVHIFTHKQREFYDIDNLWEN
ncbi:ribosome silencing factor [Anaerococcus sp. NML200574]|uniref:ribosome silencing factor n=1 Tax=unclassified Anaerococcus TaxID=2614126 RepID=UPI000D0B8E23|nr:MULTISPECIES: ribosome silencing factor [unclassified Anaerococcus]MCW6678047.1 ribosome silencing factor [Anaerococcus sp. NML200574]